MSNQRFAGDSIFAKSQAVQKALMSQQNDIKRVMDRQTERDKAAAYGKVIPFSQADIF